MAFAVVFEAELFDGWLLVFVGGGAVWGSASSALAGLIGRSEYMRTGGIISIQEGLGYIVFLRIDVACSHKVPTLSKV